MSNMQKTPNAYPLSGLEAFTAMVRDGKVIARPYHDGEWRWRWRYDRLEAFVTVFNDTWDDWGWVSEDQLAKWRVVDPKEEAK